jgi:uncharacterized membrane protein
MPTGRLEAFSDGVIAILITIMVLELKAPHDETLAALRPKIPIFLSYVLSFIYLGIYWNNHHHLFHAAQRLTGAVLWANLHLLFWLSLIPFTTSWMDEAHFAKWPVAAYGIVLLMCAIAYEILARVLARGHQNNEALSRALKKDWKEKLSIVLYIAAVPLAFVAAWAAESIYAIVAILWFIPDRRIEAELKHA